MSERSVPQPPVPLSRRAVAEGIGAFGLVFAGCGAIVTDAHVQGSLGTVGIALVFGLIILALIACLGHLSSAHFNPAVSLSFYLTRHLPLRDLAAYVGAQTTGAVIAALLLLAAWPDQPAQLGATVPSVGLGTAVVYEAVMSFLLMLVIISVATDARAVGAPAAIAIGATVALDSMFGGPLTGASMNPARSFGPALASGEWRDFWVYLLGPFTGAAAGAFTYTFLCSGRVLPAAEPQEA